MIVDNYFLNKLRDFGLNSYESKLWVALLSRGSSTAGELSDISNVPRSRSYDVLESLQKKGFITVKQEKPIKYTAIPPSQVIEHIKKKVDQQTYENIDSIEKLKSSNLFSELQNLNDQGSVLLDPSDMNGVLRGRESIYNHLSLLLKKAKKHIQISTTTENIKDIHKTLVASLITPADKNIKIQVLLPTSIKNKDLPPALAEYADVRFATQNIPRFAVVDGKEIVMMLFDGNSIHPFYDVGVWVAADFFAKTLSSLFQSAWSQAI